MTCLIAPLAYLRMFVGFQAWDDEGLFLVTLRGYLSGQPLMIPYVPPLYGPFYFEVLGGVFKLLGVSPTHETGRLVTTAFWLTCSAVGGVAALRLTRSLWLGLAAQSITFIALAALALEPTSTYGLSILIELCLVVLATFRYERPSLTALLIGALVGALLLIKVNLGVFAALAVAFAWAASLEQRARRLLFPAVAGVMTVLPAVLLYSLLRQAWALEFAAVSVLSIGAVALTGLLAPPRMFPAPGIGRLILGGVLVVVATFGVALAGGAHLDQMFRSLFLYAFQFPRVFSTPLEVNLAVAVWAAVLFASAMLQARRPVDIPGLGRVGAGLFTWAAILLLPSPIYLLTLPLAWLATMAPRNDSGNPVNPYSRLFIPALALLETLQAYPVAGTQVSLAGLGLMPVGAILLVDGVRQVRLESEQRQERAALASWIPRIALAASLAMVALYGFVIVSAFDRGTPLGLQGAQSVRLGAEQRAALRDMVGAIDSSRCTYLITYPGMNSFYIWTNAGSSVQMRETLWYVTVDSADQAVVVQQLKRQQGLCVVRNQKLIDFWGRGGPPPSGPIVNFVSTDFVHAATYGDYELLVRAS